jgi:hypothetical protein
MFHILWYNVGEPCFFHLIMFVNNLRQVSGSWTHWMVIKKKLNTQNRTTVQKQAIRVWFGLWCWMPLWTIFQLSCGGQFYLRKIINILSMWTFVLIITIKEYYNMKKVAHIMTRLFCSTECRSSLAFRLSEVARYELSVFFVVFVF